MRCTLIAVALFALTISSIACAPAAHAPAPPPPTLPASHAALLLGDTKTSANQTAAPSAERMIVYTVRLALEVQDADKASSDIAAIAAQFKGYVVASNLTRDAKGQMRGTLTLRIPAESLDAAQKQIEAVALKVLSRSSDSRDVTDQYTDLDVQLKNLEATEVELRKMLETARERSGKAEDILAVYRELANVRTQIEQIKGQMNVLEKTTALVMLTVDLIPREEVQVLEPETWAPNRTAAQALRTLVQALQAIVDLAIWFILFVLPILIILLLPLILLALRLRALIRRRAKKPTIT